MPADCFKKQDDHETSLHTHHENEFFESLKSKQLLQKEAHECEDNAKKRRRSFFFQVFISERANIPGGHSEKLTQTSIPMHQITFPDGEFSSDMKSSCVLDSFLNRK